MKKLRLLFILLISFVLLAGCTGPQTIKFKSCEEKKGAEVECRTFEINAKTSILPF